MSCPTCRELCVMPPLSDTARLGPMSSRVTSLSPSSVYRRLSTHNHCHRPFTRASMSPHATTLSQTTNMCCHNTLVTMTNTLSDHTTRLYHNDNDVMPLHPTTSNHSYAQVYTYIIFTLHFVQLELTHEHIFLTK